MGLLDHLKDKAGELGERAKAGFGAARGGASELVEEVVDWVDAYDRVLEAAEQKAAARLAGPDR